MSDEIKNIIVNPEGVPHRALAASKRTNFHFLLVVTFYLIFVALVITKLTDNKNTTPKEKIQTCYEFNNTDGKMYLIPIQCTISDVEKSTASDKEVTYV